MKIFHFIDSMRIGGSEGQTAEVAARFVAAGHDVHIGCLHLDGPNLIELKKRNITCIEFPLHGGVISPSGLRRILTLSQYLRREKFDVVHTHDLYSNLIAVPAAKIAGTKLIISSRRDLASWWWYTPRNRRILRWIQKLSKYVLANSQGVKDFLVNEDGFAPAHVRVIRNAVEVDRFQITPNRSAVFPGWPASDRVFAMVANMHTPTKGHSHLIDAAKLICSQHPEARFALIGDGVLRAEFQAKIDALGLHDHFRFLGARTDIPNVLAAADAAILPSLAEGLPNSVLEYLAAGKPTIATAVGGIPEIIQDRYNGILIAPADHSAISAAVLYLLDHPDEATKLAKQGQSDAREKFSFDRLMRELEELYGIRSPDFAANSR
jgi:glycosyltransferase involved in cell wall biosynthesis